MLTTCATIGLILSGQLVLVNLANKVIDVINAVASVSLTITIIREL